MIVFPNAKINLGLNIIERRSDGYHNLETVFMPVGLCDVLDVVESDIIEMTVSGNKIEGKLHENLVIKAYNILSDKYDIPPVKIHLYKVIPAGAGLGGGSSNGAFMLKLLNELFNLQIGQEQLKAYSAQLGSDCPFFIENQPAFATGRGEILHPYQIDLSEYQVVLVKPPISVSTSEAYKNIAPLKPGISLKDKLKAPIQNWKENVRNDFEFSVFEKYPEIGQIKQKLEDAGAEFSLMTGSGSSVFAIFRDLPVNFENLFPTSYFIYR